MKIFITGGAGFIGSAIVSHLQAIGKEVMVYDNLSFGKRELLKIDNAHFVKGDILDKQLLEATLAGFNPEIVIHLAAIHFIPYCNEHPFESANINITGTANLFSAAKKLSNLKTVFFASTAAVYPVWDLPIPEEMTPQPSDIYGVSKFSGEVLAERFHYETGINTIICRFFNAFGPNETNPHLIPAIQKQLADGKRKIKLGNTTPKRDFIHTSDMANAVAIMLTHCTSGLNCFNLGSGKQYSALDVIKSFEIALGESLEIEVNPDLVRKVDRPFLVADISKITKTFNWIPKVSLEEGLKTLLN